MTDREFTKSTTSNTLDKVPVHNVNNTNFEALAPLILEKLAVCEIVSLDLELSGLGERVSGVNSKDLNVRYLSAKKASEDFGIVTLGITCFSQNSESSSKTLKFKSITFNILLCDEKSLQLSRDSAVFLIDHGFDFNELFKKAVCYVPANKFEERQFDINKKSSEKKVLSTNMLRQIVIKIFQCDSKIISHNGFIDFVYLYSHFLCRLPSDINTFIQDISLLGGSKIFDTKLISLMSNFNASYLIYVFRKLQMKNSKNNRFKVKPKYEDKYLSDIHFAFCGLEDSECSSGNVCDRYGKYGWCEKGNDCSFSHNIDSIIEREENPTKKAKTDDSSDIKRPERKKYAHVQKNTHCAGFDSFICGYSFLSFLTSPLAQTQEDDWFGKISLPGFDVPLVLSPSTHYKNSKQFLELYNSEICQE